MDTKNKEFKGEKNKYVDSVEASKDEDDETKALLLPCKKGGLSKDKGKPKRKVQWNDTNGNKLAEVLEFQPSDVSDSDDDESDSCICRIM
ncbi:PREDICTED: uncharacterized protein LOC109209480 [Nicotiana attenuata]|uniref:uncharacterized protein LOC109209480 n=1 Tax=Nicotiana attenuata TaxID=49451 RepID=UPI0009048423|nr:PREDICTED: uncharacterized protein LOC109209480 [Nicotiana attenuata]